MTQLIKFVFVGLIILSCKDLSEKNNTNSQKEDRVKVDSTISKNNDLKISDDFKSDVNGLWVCYQYVSDGRTAKKNDDNAAREIARFSRFEVQNNMLSIGDCRKDIYTYKYAVELKKYEDESVFIIHFKPKKDSVTFVGGINSGENIPCEVFDNYTFYMPEADHLIHYNNGYFYHYKKSYIPSEIKNFKITGVPGTKKNEWSVKWESSTITSLEKGYEYFLATFPYGSQNLMNKIPAGSEFFDKKMELPTVKKHKIFS